jgi:hypothetical protein
MQARLDPFSFLVVSVAGWLNQRQQQVIQYLAEENRVLREHIGGRRLRFTDDQRRLACRQGQEAGSESADTSGHPRHSGNVIGMASEIDCQQI